MNCPFCQAEDSLEILQDAFVVYRFDGFGEQGEIESGQEIRTDVFDEVWVQCQQCGEKVIAEDMSDPLPESRKIPGVSDEITRRAEDEGLI